MWDDFGGMAYRGEICTRRSLGVDAVSQELFPNFLNLCEVYNIGVFWGFPNIRLIYGTYTILSPWASLFDENRFFEFARQAWAVFIEFNILASAVAPAYKLSPRNNVLVFFQVLINVFSVFGCQWNYWGSLGPWLALSHELGHNLNFDHDNSM